MDIDNCRWRSRLSWVFVGTLFILCAVLGALQYRWIGEVSIAGRERLRSSLQASLNRLSQDFNAEITAACAALVPPSFREVGTEGAPAPGLRDYELRYAEWRKSTGHSGLFKRIAVAVPDQDAPALHLLDQDCGTFAPAGWPPAWSAVKERIQERTQPGRWNRMPPPSMQAQPEGLLFEWPRFLPQTPNAEPRPFGGRETDWLILELNENYLQTVILPEMLQHHLRSEGKLDYQVEVVSRGTPRTVIFQSDAQQSRDLLESADASVGLLELQVESLFRASGMARGRSQPGTTGSGPRSGASGPPEMSGRGGPPEQGGRGWPSDPGGPRGPNADPGSGLLRRPFSDGSRWQMYVRHRAGSLDAVVARTRWRNLGVTSAILLLLLATVAALTRFLRDAQRLAELQMNFVAGVSHELRTPLTVIHTAAYNLRDGLARDPDRVERYGNLIQQESDRLGRLVEQVLRFANASAGRVIQDPKPVSVESAIDDAMESCQVEIESSHCTVERKIDAGLPLVMGDSVALQHALQNLVNNAVKYGAEGGNWIGVSAAATGGESDPAVEIRVADRGPGIPADEQQHIFDPFFRGRQAVRDQIHGTGLGLNLAKRIVEAHGGTVRVESELLKGTQFVVRIPAAPEEQQDEFTNPANRG